LKGTCDQNDSDTGEARQMGFGAMGTRMQYSASLLLPAYASKAGCTEKVCTGDPERQSQTPQPQMGAKAYQERREAWLAMGVQRAQRHLSGQ